MLFCLWFYMAVELDIWVDYRLFEYRVLRRIFGPRMK
jgi:hypothetical protein